MRHKLDWHNEADIYNAAYMEADRWVVGCDWWQGDGPLHEQEAFEALADYYFRRASNDFEYFADLCNRHGFVPVRE